MGEQNATGIDGLDAILEGGLPRPTANLRARVENLETKFKTYQPNDSVLQSGLQFADLITMAKEYTLRNMKRNILEIDILDSLTPFFLLSNVKEAFHYCQNL